MYKTNIINISLGLKYSWGLTIKSQKEEEVDGVQMSWDIWTVWDVYVLNYIRF